MRKSFISLVFIFAFSLAFAQKNGYAKIYNYGEFNKDWALVKTIANTYGFIGINGETVVQPIYDKIEKFQEKSCKYALVKTIAGTYGFINQNGKEEIPAIYWSKYDATVQLNLVKN